MANVIDLLYEIQKLMEARGENPFKVRAFEKAAATLAGREDLVARAQAGTLKQLPGIGNSIAEIVSEYLLQGTSKVRDELAQAVPAGVLELTQVPGLGPKKAMELVEKLGIQTLGELEYACKENRLLKLKGFGAKIQQKILDGIAFSKATQGKKRISDVDAIGTDLLEKLQKICEGARISETGELRRKLEILHKFEFLVEVPPTTPGSKRNIQAIAQSWMEKIQGSKSTVLPVELHFAASEKFGYQLAKTTATPEHWLALGEPAPFEAKTEEEFFENLNLPWIPPETRETGEEVQLARDGYLSQLLPWNGIRGVFHNHTTRSDGVATLDQMVAEAEKLGYEYIGISDHSQSAFYAQGLKTDTLLQQEKEVKKVQEKHPNIRVFWGIESDILADGSLDYDPEVLQRFDFVIASIHSRFQMDREQMTQRILTAIRNPYTRFLGHPTGRLLLGRKGYDVDMEAILEEAAKRDVAVELNSNPARLDIDWRWGSVMRKHKTSTSINPDAHAMDALQDTRYGIMMARKAMVSVDQIINTRSVAEVEKWLKRR